MEKGTKVNVARTGYTAILKSRCSRPPFEQTSDPNERWWQIQYDFGDIGYWPESLLEVC